MGPSASIRVKVEINLSNYFAGVFGDDPSDIMPAMNIPKTYSLSAEAWGLYADKITALDWVMKLGVLIQQSDMQTAPTISQLATLIIRRAKSPVVTLSQILAPSLIRSRMKALSGVPKDDLSRSPAFNRAQVPRRRFR